MIVAGMCGRIGSHCLFTGLEPMSTGTLSLSGTRKVFVFWETRVRGDAFVDSCGLQVCLIALRPHCMFDQRACCHVIDHPYHHPDWQACLDQENVHSHLQAPLTLIHHLQPMSVDFVAKNGLMKSSIWKTHEKDKEFKETIKNGSQEIGNTSGSCCAL